MAAISDYVSIAETKRLLSAEIKALRESAEALGDQETLVILDFLESHREGSALPLEIALQISARLAAAGGLSQRQWMQQLLSRHGSDGPRLEALWRTLVDLHVGGILPWAA